MTDNVSLSDTRVVLSTGVELDVTVGGVGDPLIFLHGFPESRRTWRHQIADFANSHFVVAPDQRGYAHSSKPPRTEDYTREELVADVIALADAFGLERFTLLGHDFGGIVAWSTATLHPDRVSRLVIANAPHPVLWQRGVVEDPDQRAASQYIPMFQDPRTADLVSESGFDTFFDTRLIAQMDPSAVSADDREAAIAALSVPGAFLAMTRWYAASGMVVPAVGADAAVPDWAVGPITPVKVPTLVVWGMGDRNLMPSQLEGLTDVVDDLHVVKLPDTGHFSPWEAPTEMTAAIRQFLDERQR